MSNLKEMRAKIKGYKKSKYPNTKGVYLSGVPGFKEGNAFYIYYDTDNNELEFINFDQEASLPVDRVKAATSFTEKEVEEFEKNRIASGLVTSALIGPVGGLLVGLSKKKKKKNKYHTFLSIVFEDKAGNENTIVFRTPSESNTGLFFNKFLNALKPNLPAEEIPANGKIEL